MLTPLPYQPLRATVALMRMRSCKGGPPVQLRQLSARLTAPAYSRLFFAGSVHTSVFPFKQDPFTGAYKKL